MRNISGMQPRSMKLSLPIIRTVSAIIILTPNTSSQSGFEHVELQLVNKVTMVVTEDGSVVHVFCFLIMTQSADKTNLDHSTHSQYSLSTDKKAPTLHTTTGKNINTAITASDAL